MHVGDDVLAVDEQACRGREPQRGVQNRAVFGGVDVLAGEHRGDALAQPRLVGQRQQQAQQLGGDALLGVVEVDAGGFECEALAALRIGGEELAQVQRARWVPRMVPTPSVSSCPAIALLAATAP